MANQITPDLRPRTILLVDDEVILAMSLSRMLEKHGYQVVLAYSGEQAVEAVEKLPQLDLVLMDIELGGGMDGARAAEIILQQREVPLAFLSVHTQAQVAEKTEHIPSYGYIVKDSGESVLLASIKMALRLAEAHRLARQKEAELQERERRRIEEALRQSDTRYRLLVEGMPGVVYTFSDRRGGIYFSPYAEQVFGYPLEYLYAHPFLWNEVIHPDDFAAVMEADRKLVDGKPFDLVYRIRDGHGRWRWLLDRSIDCRIENGERLIDGVAIDITGRKQMEQEKDALFKELQHRAKNSFALIISMIQLMQNASQGAETQAALADLEARTRAMAELYQLLATTDTINQVRLDEYCARVVASLHLSEKIRFQQDYAALTAPAAIAAPLGLILTELITNAIKYAFPDRRGGTVTVALCQPRAGYARLEVADDGAGLPAAFDPAHNDSLGLSLVRTLSLQIQGNFQIDGDRGTRCAVEFPI